MLQVPAGPIQKNSFFFIGPVWRLENPEKSEKREKSESDDSSGPGGAGVAYEKPHSTDQSHDANETANDLDTIGKPDGTSDPNETVLETQASPGHAESPSFDESTQTETISSEPAGPEPKRKKDKKEKKKKGKKKNEKKAKKKKEKKEKKEKRVEPVAVQTSTPIPSRSLSIPKEGRSGQQRASEPTSEPGDPEGQGRGL
jgi:hypothetical protein